MYTAGYVASPLGASSKRKIKKNMLAAKRYEKALKQLTGDKTRAIHAYVPNVLDDTNKEERLLGLEMGIKLLDLSDALILCGNRLSAGMENELERAICTQKKIYVLIGKPSSLKIINRILIALGLLSIQKKSESEAVNILLRKEIA